MKKIITLFLLISFSWSCKSQQQGSKTATGPHIVFVMGDDEYRSEQSMPMLAEILKREINAKVTLCFSIDSLGFIDPTKKDNIEGLEALETADLMVMFSRFRALPEESVNYILDYVESGKPIVGFRTATHAFKYPDGHKLEYLNNEWPAKVFGQQWITHHGHFSDGHKPLTEVYFPENVSSPLLNGVEPFMAYSWLYHVDGGKWKLNGDSSPILMGKTLRSNHAEEKFSHTNPIAWTKTYTGTSGKTSKVFFTTLGHPYDFKYKSMRKLALNGIYQVLDLKIPANGVNDSPVNEYKPSNSGIGKNYIKGVKAH